ncbi:Hypothetical predicted protein [Octopus vulgaris]|uniref:Uncharacterized protein n=1 Tax=Octopus vulgaris TaxID=6645 RepID=A0AA36B0A6_OCTVU|nr:Hypothetical predicted protein [Octopus vulgaris]
MSSYLLATRRSKPSDVMNIDTMTLLIHETLNVRHNIQKLQAHRLAVFLTISSKLNKSDFADQPYHYERCSNVNEDHFPTSQFDTEQICEMKALLISHNEPSSGS